MEKEQAIAKKEPNFLEINQPHQMKTLTFLNTLEVPAVKTRIRKQV